jgi:outer membrane protein assembly factor BamD
MMVPIPVSCSVPRARRRLAYALLLVAATVAACGGSSSQAKLPAAGTVNPDKFLFDRGAAAMEKKHFLEAREYYKRIVDSYPQSQYRADAKLGVGDSYLLEKHSDADIVAISQYREFLQFYPTNPRADYAQYQICVAQSRAMLNAERDQTATTETIKQAQLFLEAYPNSKYRSEVQTIDRTAKDRLSEHEFVVGMYYFRNKLWGGAADRFNYLLAHDPEYTKRDQVYYYLAESFMLNKLDKLALPLYQRVINEFPQSKFVEPSRKRIAEITR